MIKLTLKGTLTSKRAAHVPVIRKWKLVFERREFGTEVREINFDKTLLGASFGDRVKVRVTSDLTAVVELIRAYAQFEEPSVRVSLEWQGIEIPGSSSNVRIQKKLSGYPFEIETDLFKGVKLNLKGEVTQI